MADTISTRAVRFRRGITLPVLLPIVWEVSSRTGFADSRFLSFENVALTAKRQLLRCSFAALGRSRVLSIAKFRHHRPCLFRGDKSKIATRLLGGARGATGKRMRCLWNIGSCRTA